MKSYKDLERIIKGTANHRRIQLLDKINETPELSVEDLAGKFDIDYRTVSSHLKRLEISGLVMKRSEGHRTRHKVTNRGAKMLKFLKKLD
jgi:predicted transcriptional regulator